MYTFEPPNLRGDKKKLFLFTSYTKQKASINISNMDIFARKLFSTSPIELPQLKCNPGNFQNISLIHNLNNPKMRSQQKHKRVSVGDKIVLSESIQNGKRKYSS